MKVVADEELPGEAGGVGSGLARKLPSSGWNAASMVEIVSEVDSREYVEKIEVGESLSAVKIRGGEYGNRGGDCDVTGETGLKPRERRGR